jgi:hypothetical protein
MKKLIFTTVFFTSIALATAAQDTTMVEQYCRIVITGRSFTTKVVIDVDFGEERRSSGFNWLKDEMTGKVKKFNSIVDALNYMGSQGWSLVNAFPVGESHIYHYYFKKFFRKTDAN